ncbi:MFS transporter [Prochlorococcus sp. MIT 1307]|uniref:MFS transporter n=1 Tax=Prochlorococcus sp. MIT 1307 TaxID=3096219 RepID=UPI002A753BF1|nr:MFS transporter [Prochlorococcus sp. MIT 1307]
MPNLRPEKFINKPVEVISTPRKEHSSSKAKRTFIWLWFGQLVSNLGTQTSLYAIGLWYFSKTQELSDFALVALVVQLARILVLPLLSKRLATWSRKRVMLIANGIGAVCTLALAMLLLRSSSMAPLLAVLSIQAFAAMAEATLILSFSSLIPVLIADKEILVRANGLFATTDSLVLTMAPFLGSWLSGLLGLQGVLSLDGCSFFLALICVLKAPWSSNFVGHSDGIHQWSNLSFLQNWKRFNSLWLTMPLARVIFVISTAVAFSYAATEVLFPAWVAVAFGTKQMAIVLIVAALGYLIGFLAWRQKIGLYWNRVWVIVLLIQSLILMGAGLQIFSDNQLIWFMGLFFFSSGLPIVMSSIQQFWSELVPAEELPEIFALRYIFEWTARLIAFLTVSIAVDNFLTPALHWPHLPFWIQTSLGIGEGRSIAVALGGVGWVLALSIWSQSENIKSRKARAGCS